MVQQQSLPIGVQCRAFITVDRCFVFPPIYTRSREQWLFVPEAPRVIGSRNTVGFRLIVCGGYDAREEKTA